LRKKEGQQIWPLIVAVAGVPIIINPWNNFDAVNLPKFVLLVLIAGYLLPETVNRAYSFHSRQSGKSVFGSLSILIPFIFLISLLPAIFFSGAGIWSQIYGAQGRNTGLLTYIALIVLFLVSSFRAEKNLISKFLQVLPIVGVGLSLYACLQQFGFDPISWRNPYSPVVSTLGNPNFVSSFLGITSVLTLTHIFVRGSISKQFVFSIIYLFQIYSIYLTKSVQGLILAVAGLILLVLIFSFRNRKRLLRYSFIALTSVGTVFLAGFFGLGPLGDLLERPSLTYRYYFWLAGIKMLNEHPLTGIGIDRYGDWYKSTRSPEMVSLIGEAVSTDSAHNVLIDLGAGGGYPVLVAAIALFGLITISALLLIFTSSSFSIQKITLCVGWFCYLLQSMISINQLGLATLGFVLGGLCVGMAIADRKSTRSVTTTNQLTSEKATYSKPKTMVSVTTAVVIAGLAMLPYSQDLAFRSAWTQSNGAGLISASASFPPNEFLMTYTAIVLAQDGFDLQARELLLKSISVNPRYEPAYIRLIGLEGTSEAEREKYKQIIKILNPYKKF